MSDICRFQLLKSENLLLFFVIRDSKWTFNVLMIPPNILAIHSYTIIYVYQNMLTTTQTAPNHPGITSCRAAFCRETNSLLRHRHLLLVKSVLFIQHIDHL